MLLKICDDVLLHILSFLTLSDFENLSLVNKSFNRDLLWIYIGQREHPYLSIKNRNDFYSKQLNFICSKDIYDAIQTNNWFSKYYFSNQINLNGKEDTITKEYIKDIVRKHLIVKKLTDYKKDKCMDCKIAINCLIEDLQEEKEKDRDDMMDHIDFLKK